MTTTLCEDSVLLIDGEFLKNLKNLGLLEPGIHITGETVERILGVRHINGDWNFLGRYLTLKSQIESCGFFVTQKNVEAPGFRILNTEEMSDHAAKNLAKSMAICFKTGLIMAVHDSSKLEERAKKIYDGIRNKAANMALAQQQILMEGY